MISTRDYHNLKGLVYMNINEVDYLNEEHLNSTQKNFITNVIKDFPQSQIIYDRQYKRISLDYQLVIFLNPKGDEGTMKYPISISFKYISKREQMFVYPLFTFDWSIFHISDNDEVSKPHHKIETIKSPLFNCDRTVLSYNRNTKKIISEMISKFEENLARVIILDKKVDKERNKTIDSLFENGWISSDLFTFYNFNENDIDLSYTLEYSVDFMSGEVFPINYIGEKVSPLFKSDIYLKQMIRLGSFIEPSFFIEETRQSTKYDLILLLNFYIDKIVDLRFYGYSLDGEYRYLDNKITIKNHDFILNDDGIKHNICTLDKFFNNYNDIVGIRKMLNNTLMEKYGKRP